MTAVKLSAILPLPVSVAQQPASVFVPVAGEPVLARIVRALSASVGDVLVVADARLAEDVRTCLHRLPVQVITAGELPSAADCLASAAQHLRATPVTHVVVADHRYPMLPAAMVSRVIAALTAGAETAVPVLPVTDTVKCVDEQGIIRSTVDRAELRTIQYPYGTTVQRLGDLPALLGDAGVVTVDGDADAIPVDLPGDAALLEAIITCRR